MANAQLIAAAPDLLAALKALVVATGRADNPSDCGVASSDPVVLEAIAIIAKADQP